MHFKYNRIFKSLNVSGTREDRIFKSLILTGTKEEKDAGRLYRITSFLSLYLYVYLTRNKYYLKSKLSWFPPFLTSLPSLYILVYICIYIIYIYMSCIQFEGKLSSFVLN